MDWESGNVDWECRLCMCIVNVDCECGLQMWVANVGCEC